MPELTSMKNIGKELAKKLTAVGIDSPGQLTALGSKEAFIRLKEAFPQVCLVHLYALEGAIHNTALHCLSNSQKEECKKFSDSLKEKSVPANSNDCR